MIAAVPRAIPDHQRAVAIETPFNQQQRMPNNHSRWMKIAFIGGFAVALVATAIHLFWPPAADSDYSLTVINGDDASVEIDEEKKMAFDLDGNFFLGLLTLFVTITVGGLSIYIAYMTFRLATRAEAAAERASRRAEAAAERASRRNDTGLLMIAFEMRNRNILLESGMRGNEQNPGAGFPPSFHRRRRERIPPLQRRTSCPHVAKQNHPNLLVQQALPDPPAPSSSRIRQLLSFGNPRTSGSSTTRRGTKDMIPSPEKQNNEKDE